MSPNPYLFIVIFVGVALVFPLIPLALAWLWRRFFQPPKPGAEKNATYECGVESIGDAQIQFRSQYYLYAIIFNLRRGGDFSGAICGCVHWFASRRVHCHPHFPAPADRRSYLGLGQRVLKLGALARWLKLLKALHCYNGR